MTFLVGITRPAVLDSLRPALAVFAHADDDIEAIVARVQTLSVSLRAVADERERVVLEVLLQLRQRPV